MFVLRSILRIILTKNSSVFFYVWLCVDAAFCSIVCLNDICIVFPIILSQSSKSVQEFCWFSNIMTALYGN